MFTLLKVERWQRAERFCKCTYRHHDCVSRHLDCSFCLHLLCKDSVSSLFLSRFCKLLHYCVDCQNGCHWYLSIWELHILTIRLHKFRLSIFWATAQLPRTQKCMHARKQVRMNVIACPLGSMSAWCSFIMFLSPCMSGSEESLVGLWYIVVPGGITHQIMNIMKFIHHTNYWY